MLPFELPIRIGVIEMTNTLAQVAEHFHAEHICALNCAVYDDGFGRRNVNFRAVSGNEIVGWRVWEITEILGDPIADGITARDGTPWMAYCTHFWTEADARDYAYGDIESNRFWFSVVVDVQPKPIVLPTEHGPKSWTAAELFANMDPRPGHPRNG